MPGNDELMNSADWAMQARTRLARRRAEKPATKSGQIRALWPDIEAALAVGQSMKTICTWLAEEAGITLGVTSLTSYVSRIRRREITAASVNAGAGSGKPNISGGAASAGFRAHTSVTGIDRPAACRDRL